MQLAYFRLTKKVISDSVAASLSDFASCQIKLLQSKNKFWLTGNTESELDRPTFGVFKLGQ